MPLADVVMRLILLLPTALNDQTDLAASILHDIEARVSSELKETERIVLPLLDDRGPVIAAPLHD